MTTVGYGDLSPQTDARRVLAVAVMLTGIGFVAILTGAVAEPFLSPDVESVAEDVTALEPAEVAAADCEHTMEEELREVRRLLESIEARLPA